MSRSHPRRIASGAPYFTGVTVESCKYDLNGRYLLDMGGHGPQPGQFDGVHQISVDQERNLYVTEVANDRSQKFRPKPDADPARIIGPMVGWSRGAR